MPPEAAIVPISPKAPPTEDPRFDELGVTLDLPFGSYSAEIQNPNEQSIPDLLLRLDTMQRTDGHMRALYRLLSLPFRRAKWHMEPADAGDKEADLIEQMFTRPPYEGGMTTSFDYIRALGSKSFVNGFQVWEEVYQYSEVPGHGEMITLRKLAPRSARTLRFRADPNGGFDGVVQRAYAPLMGYKEVTIPKEKSFFFTVDKEEHPFYGRSLFEPALYHFDKKQKLYYIAHIAAQMGAVPARLGYEDSTDLTPADRVKFRAALASLGFNSAMLVPKGMRVESFGEKSGGMNSELLALINHHNVQSSQSVLAQFIDLGQDSTQGRGSYALSKDSSDLFLMCEETLLASFAEHINWYIIPKFIDWNFGSKKYPKLVFDPLADDLRDALITIFTEISTAETTNVSPDFLFELEKRVAERLDLEVDYEAIEEERERQRQQTQEVTEAITAIMGGGLEPEPVPPELPDGQNPAKEPPGGPPGSKPSQRVAAAEMEAGLILLAETKRDRLGQFSRINEVGQGDGFSSKQKQSTRGIVTDVQKRLEALGLALGDAGVDGLFGPVTAAAVSEFQRQNGLPETGRMDLGTYALLLEATPSVDAAPVAEVVGGENNPNKGRPGTPTKKTAKKAAASKKAAKKVSAPRGAKEAAERLRGTAKPATEED